jgi:hypothetical protein
VLLLLVHLRACSLIRRGQRQQLLLLGLSLARQRREGLQVRNGCHFRPHKGRHDGPAAGDDGRIHG